MLDAVMGVTANVAIVATSGLLAATACAVGYRACEHAVRPCLTILRDGTTSEEVDSFHMRTWLIGLGVPSYRRTAVRGILTVAGMLAAAMAILLVALSLASKLLP